MSSKLTKEYYLLLIEDDIKWLKFYPRTLMRDHIIEVLEDSVNYYYPPEKQVEKRYCPNGHEMGEFWADCDHGCIGK